MDANQEWEIREITSEEDVDDLPHCLVNWCLTLISKDSMENAQELVAEYEARKARIRAGRGIKKGRKGRRDLKQGRRKAAEADVLGGQQTKRPRGRPRKQK